MKKTFLVLVLFVACLLAADTFSVQGVLRDPLGKTVEDGYYVMSFGLYSNEASSTAIWEEIHTSVLISNGVYLVELGSVTSLDEVPFNENYWIGISINNGTEMEPRIKLTKSPAAMSVFGANNVFPSTGFVGVGTHEPEAFLHIVDSTPETDKVRVEGDDGVNDFVINSEGKVGVNVEEPEADLHIQATNPETDKLLITNADGSPNVIVKADGRMGLNTEEPLESLDITGNLKMRNGSILFEDGSALNSADFGGAASSITNYGTVFITADSDNDGNGSIELRSGETTVMEVTAEEDIIINAYKFVSLADKFFIGHNDQSPYNTTDVDIREKYVTIRAGSSLPAVTGIWGDDPGDLFVQGSIETNNIYIHNAIDEDEVRLTFSDELGGWPWYIGKDYGGNLVFGRGQNEATTRLAEISFWGEYLDVYTEYRQNTEPYEGTLEKIAELNPIKYDALDDQDRSRKQIGFINGDVQRLFPELVYDSSNASSIGINTSGFGIVAISAVKELNQKVEDQEKKIEELEKALAALMQKIENLKN
jgi:hypothetical protein